MMVLKSVPHHDKKVSLNLENWMRIIYVRLIKIEKFSISIAKNNIKKYLLTFTSKIIYIRIVSNGQVYPFYWVFLIIIKFINNKLFSIINYITVEVIRERMI